MTLRFWTPDEDRRLATLVAQGLRDPEIANELGRTPVAVVQRRHVKGLRRIRGPRTPASTIATICELIETGATGPEIARRFGISVGRVHYYGRREGAIRPNAKTVHDVRAIDADLLDLRAAGVRRVEIARRLGVTESAVSCRLTTLARRDAVAEARAGD